MKDIQVVRLSDVLPVTGISRVPGVVPRSVMLTGSDFQNVESVYLNGSLSPEFVVMSSREVLAQVPDDQLEQSINEAYVLSTRLSFTERSLIEFTLGLRPQLVSGTLSLVQNFVRLLLRRPGTNIFHRDSGGGLFHQVGKLIGSSARDRVGAEAAVAVARTRQYFIAKQTPNRSLPPDERLLSAEVVGLSVEQKDSIVMSVSVKSHAGITAAATIIR